MSLNGEASKAVWVQEKEVCKQQAQKNVWTCSPIKGSKETKHQAAEVGVTVEQSLPE